MMTEAEAIELIAIFTTNVIASNTIYLSFTFAYLTAAYFVGASLSRFQAIFVSVLYALAANGAMMTQLGSIQAWSIIMEEHATALDSVPMYNGEFWQIAIPISLSIMTLASLYFMWNVRHRRIA